MPIQDKLIAGTWITEDDPLPVSGADGIGTVDDAAATAGSTGTLSAKLRTISATLGAVADAAWTTGSGSVVAILKSIRGALPAALGQTTAALSLPTVDAADTWTSPDNSIVSVTSSATTLIAVAGAGVRKRNAVLYNMGAQTVSIRFGADPTAGTHFPLVAGATLPCSNLLVVKGIVASGTCNVAVISEAAS